VANALVRVAGIEDGSTDNPAKKDTHTSFQERGFGRVLRKRSKRQNQECPERRLESDLTNPGIARGKGRRCRWARSFLREYSPGYFFKISLTLSRITAQPRHGLQFFAEAGRIPSVSSGKKNGGDAEADKESMPEGPALINLSEMKN